MRVLQVINSLNIGGAEKLLVDAIPLFKKRGIEMELMLLNGEGTPFFNKLKEQKVIIHTLSNGDTKKIYNPVLIFYIIPYLKKYDIIHVHLFPSLYWVALAKLLSFSKVNLLFTEHNTQNRRRKKKYWYYIDRFIYKKYKVVVSITKEVNDSLKSYLSLNTDKFRIINNGIDLSRFIDLPSQKTQDGSKIIVMQISSFREQKDQATLIRAMQYVPDNVVLYLVGDGEKRILCENLANELNLSDRVFFFGIRMDIPELLNSADIVVLSSHWEGFGLAIVEGMAAQKPVIASNVPGLKNVVNEAGLLFTQGDEKDLAGKIISLIDNPDFYSEIAYKCTERAKQYDINTMVDKYIDIYKKIYR